MNCFGIIFRMYFTFILFMRFASIKLLVPLSSLPSPYSFIFCIYKLKLSNFGYLPIIYFSNLFLELLFTYVPMIELAVVFLRQSMRVAVYVTTFAFNSKQAYFFIAIETTFLIFLLFFWWI